MGQPAAKLGDMIKQDMPHCHAPIHPAAPVPTPVPHPGMPLAITSLCAVTVMVGGAPAAVVGSLSAPCMLPACVPAGPGMIIKGSMTIFIEGKPQARVIDMSSHPSCVAPIPAPLGKIMPPGCPTVMIGG